MEASPLWSGDDKARLPRQTGGWVTSSTLCIAAIVLATLGNGGTRSTLSTMGENQFNKPKAQGIFFNWFFFFVYGSSVVASTTIVYVEDNVNFTPILSQKEVHSPTWLARVVVASIRKRKVLIPSTSEDFYHGPRVAARKAIGVANSRTIRVKNMEGLNQTELTSTKALITRLKKADHLNKLKQTMRAPGLLFFLTLFFRRDPGLTISLSCSSGGLLDFLFFTLFFRRAPGLTISSPYSSGGLLDLQFLNPVLQAGS
ncbi:hypothetical protein BC332_17098 [Capsicum chinense]|nr:hypothetical protein BC332_17098 [Capsicum chinense]